jgi:hypothetical protein
MDSQLPASAPGPFSAAPIDHGALDSAFLNEMIGPGVGRDPNAGAASIIRGTFAGTGTIGVPRSQLQSSSASATSATSGASGSQSQSQSLSDLRNTQFAQLMNDTNRLLSAIGISAKQISSIEELSRVASSMIVAVYESVFETRLDNIIRNPESRAQYVHNAQIVINELSDRIQMDLAHITGESVVNGDFISISHLVNLFTRVVIITDGTDDVDMIPARSQGHSHAGGRQHITQINAPRGGSDLIGRRLDENENDRMQDSISVSLCRNNALDARVDSSLLPF